MLPVVSLKYPGDRCSARCMSVFRVSVRFSNLAGSATWETQAVVDTGSTLSKIPQSAAVELGLEPHGTRTFRLANNKEVERPVAWTRVECEGRSEKILVAIGEDVEIPLLGATALEHLGFAADPVNEILVPTSYYELSMESPVDPSPPLAAGLTE